MTINLFILSPTSFHESPFYNQHMPCDTIFEII